MHPDEERLLLACLPGAIAFQPPMEGYGVAPYEQDFCERHCPRLLILLALPPLGRWELAAIAVWDIAGS